MSNEKRTHSKWEFSQEQSIYFQLTHIFYSSKPRVPESQLHFLVYLYLYPDKFREKLIKENKFQSVQAIRNAQSLLLKSKILSLIPDAKAKNLAYVYDINPILKRAIVIGDFESIVSIRVHNTNTI